MGRKIFGMVFLVVSVFTAGCVPTIYTDVKRVDVDGKPFHILGFHTGNQDGPQLTGAYLIDKGQVIERGYAQTKGLLSDLIGVAGSAVHGVAGQAVRRPDQINVGTTATGGAADSASSSSSSSSSDASIGSSFSGSISSSSSSSSFSSSE